MLEWGTVEFVPNTEYVGDHTVVSRISGRRFQAPGHQVALKPARGPPGHPGSAALDEARDRLATHTRPGLARNQRADVNGLLNRGSALLDGARQPVSYTARARGSAGASVDGSEVMAT